jgi:nicotinate-nucleotide adenylyltransferase
LARRVGIFGGSFDPPHVGHLIIADRVLDELGLDLVALLPSARPPHKPAGVTPAHLRLDMTRLAAAGHPAFLVSALELERTGPSYTADTLDRWKLAYPDDEITLILGADSLEDLPGWHEPGRIAKACRIAVVGRPGHEAATVPEFLERVRRERGLEFNVVFVPMPPLAISSTEIRERVRGGRSCRYMVPDAVLGLINALGLYRDPDPPPHN